MKTPIYSDVKYSDNLGSILADIDFFVEQIKQLDKLRKSNTDIMNLYPHRSEHCQHNIDEIDLILLRLNQLHVSLVDRAYELSEPVFCSQDLQIVSVAS